MFQRINFIRTLFLSAVIFLYVPDLLAQYLLSIDSLKTILSTSDIDSVKTKVLFEIGREKWFDRDFSEAAHYLHRSVDLAEKCRYRAHQADAYNILGNVYMKQESFDSAFSCLQKALELKDQKFIPLIQETYSKLYFQLGDYQTSLQYALQSADEFEKDSNPLFNMQTVFAYLMVGDILDRLGRADRAFEYYQKAYKKARTSGKDWYIKTPIQRIAGYYFLKNELTKARHMYDTIIAIDKTARSFEPTMYSYEGLGNIAMKENNFKKAIEYYRLSLRYALEKNLANNIENFYTKLGTGFLSDKQSDSAMYYLQLAINQSIKSKNYSNLSGAYKFLSIVQQQQKNYPDALLSFQRHTAYYDSLLNAEKMKSINNLEILYRTRQKENEILRLQQAEQEKDFAIKKRNIYIGIGLVLMLAMVIIFLLLRRNYRNRQYLQEEKVKQMERQQQVISLQSMINGQEAERTRIAKDLHDGLGGLFSTVKMYFSTLEHEHSNLKSNEIFKKSYSLVDTASVEIRRIAHNMMPEVLMKLGLSNAIKDLCDNISAGKLLNVSLEVHGMNGRLNTATEIMLYRIIQELLNNIIKHAQATEAIIQFIRDEDRLSVVVEDNGCGFNTQETDEKIHAGIETIKSRVNYLNGKLTIDSQKDVGTTVMMDFLINEM